MIKYQKDKTKNFLDSLDYYEAINLLTVLLKAYYPEWSNSDCYSEALARYSDESTGLTHFFNDSLKTGLH